MHGKCSTQQENRDNFFQEKTQMQENSWTLATIETSQEQTSEEKHL